jgi:uncharacterized repeat protein (TIGR01451 family)
MTIKMPTLTVALLLMSLVFAVSSASAEESAPQWTISAVSMPTNFTPNDAKSGEDLYRVVIINTGSAPSTGTITVTDTLPAGLTLDPAGISGVDQLSGMPLSCGGPECSYSEPVAPGDSLKLAIPVDTGAAGSETNVISVSGGGAEEVSKSTPTEISSTPAAFGIASGSANTVLSNDQAGAHADLTTTIAFNTISHTGILAGEAKNTTDNLPSGFAGDLVDTPTCPVAYFSAHNSCPVDTQIGTTTVVLEQGGFPLESIAPVYNLAPNPGATAKLAFYAGRTFGIQGDVSIRPGDEGLETTFHNVKNTASVDSVVLTIWGVPTAASHAALFGVECYSQGQGGNCGAPVTSSGAVVPFLTNPTSCTGASLEAEFKVESWEQIPGEEPFQELMSFGPLTGCEHLSMDPSIKVEPTTSSASSATGLDVNLEVPQTYENAEGLATANLMSAVVTLPEGMTLNPSAAAGLGYCTEEELASETASSLQGEGCPNNAKIGTVRVKSPGISEEATGALYVAQPFANRFGSLIALYIVAKIPNRGIIVRSAGKVEPNLVTGQLTTTFPENPQLPFSDFTLSFRQGQTSPLVTPPACGSYTTTGEMTPWSNLSETIPVSSVFEIPNGIGGGACPAGRVPPFAPSVSAGSENNEAGAYSALAIRISRGDGEQEITGFSSKLPAGLSADLTGVPFCPEADIALARTVSGAQEEADPSCPAATEIGHTTANAGVGSVLAQTPGKVYMAGPFEGAPFSIVSITSAKVGPFDLGTVVVHLPLFINPETAEVSIPAGAADQIPHIIKGIVIHLREILIYINRPKFSLNPTSCAPMSFAATVVGGGADPTNPADNDPVTVASPFRVTACQALKFAPKFALSTPGKGSKAEGTSLSVKLTYPSAPQGTQSNIRYVKVDLPLQLPSRLGTLQRACVAAVFAANPANCPPESIVGHATAVTPILPVPLTGPAYFVSNAGLKFPELVLVLQGYGVKIVLRGETLIKKGITSSTFKAVPDQPVTSFELTLPAGKYSALGVNVPEKDDYNLCGDTLTAPTAFIAQNGLEIHQTTPVAITGCRTNAKKLAAALKACRKKPRGKRGACEKAARKKYSVR